MPDESFLLGRGAVVLAVKNLNLLQDIETEEAECLVVLSDSGEDGSDHFRLLFLQIFLVNVPVDLAANLVSHSNFI